MLTELDTITDFTDYLASKERLRRVVCEGSEANMLAWYLARKYAGKGDVVVGIGISPYQPGIGSKSDLTYVKFPRWSEVEIEHAEEYQRITGDFAGQLPIYFSSTEYPPGSPVKQ